MSRIENVVNTLNQVSGRLDEATAAASAALLATDEAIAGANDLGTRGQANALTMVRGDVEHVQTGVKELQDLVAHAAARAQAVGGDG